MYRINQALSDGIVVWQLENTLHSPARGVFTERQPVSPADYDQMAYFPGRTSGTPGWFQSWSFAIDAPGLHTLLSRSETSTSVDGPRLVARVSALDSSATEAMLWEAGVTGGPFLGSVKLDVPPSTTELRVEMVEIGSLDCSFQFRLLDSEGARLYPAAYDAGVDEQTRSTYECTTAFFMGLPCTALHDD